MGSASLNIDLESKMKKSRYLFLALMLLCNFTLAQGPLDQLFADYPGTMVIYDQSEQNYIIVNEARATIRYTPWSTFKIPNSIIALEARAVESVDEVIRWDEERYPKEDWWPATWEGDQTLRSGIQYSTVPLYRTVALRVGEEKMHTFLQEFNYGNMDISSGLDNFWLNGSLQISAMEQVEFLKKFYYQRLKVSESSAAAVKEILVRESTDQYTFSYKTGAGTIDREQNLALGWLAGYVEKGEHVYFFAANIEGEGFRAVLEPRFEIPVSVLKKLGILE